MWCHKPMLVCGDMYKQELELGCQALCGLLCESIYETIPNVSNTLFTNADGLQLMKRSQGCDPLLQLHAGHQHLTAFMIYAALHGWTQSMASTLYKTLYMHHKQVGMLWIRAKVTFSVQGLLSGCTFCSSSLLVLVNTLEQTSGQIGSST